MYSYLLRPVHPGEQTQEHRRYLDAIRAYLSADKIEKRGRTIERTGYNVIYAPVASPPPEEYSADWVLEHYNFQRSVSLLKPVDNEQHRMHLGGPYILSASSPLSPESDLSRLHYLYFDLGGVPNDMIELWVRAFAIQASKARFWEIDTQEMFTLGVRTYINKASHLRPGLPDGAVAIIWHAR